MNYLAHIFLSGDNRKLQLGNFMGDFVKGRQHEDYPKLIQSGILLHREIDTFTDNHPIFCDTVALLRPTFARYSGIMADMYYDYCLATEFERYSPNKSLDSLARGLYITSLLNYKILPERIKSFIFHFITTNRLKKYASMDGLEDSLTIMSAKKSSAIQPTLSIQFLKDNENIIRAQFNKFMPEVIKFSESYINDMNTEGR